MSLSPLRILTGRYDFDIAQHQGDQSLRREALPLLRVEAEIIDQTKELIARQNLLFHRLKGGSDISSAIGDNIALRYLLLHNQQGCCRGEPIREQREHAHGEQGNTNKRHENPPPTSDENP